MASSGANNRNATPPSGWCLWLVPSGSGQARKLRVPSSLVVVGIAAAVVCGAALTLVMVDYARVQVDRQQYQELLRKVMAEREQLKSSASSLQESLALLESQSDAGQQFQAELSEQLSELEALIAGAKTGGAPRVSPKGGVGGAEIPCRVGERDCDVRAGIALNRSQGESPTPRQGVREQIRTIAEELRRLPLGVPAQGEVNSHFGPRISPFTGRWARHEGIDFQAPPGSPVVASGDGVVIAARWDRTYGNVVDIRHTPMIVSRYAHLSRIKVRVGQTVARGDRIGSVGSTGRSTGPHLHYEVIVSGAPKDPKKFLRLSSELQSAMSSIVGSLALVREEPGQG